jgi:hypothetical protein
MEALWAGFVNVMVSGISANNFYYILLSISLLDGSEWLISVRGVGAGMGLV